MASILNRRKWMSMVLIVGVFLTLVTMTLIMRQKAPLKPGKATLPEQIKFAVGVDRKDPQRFIPEKSRLYDFDIVCGDEDREDTPFLKTLRDNETIILPEVSMFDKLSREELSALYHAYIETVQYFCKRIVKRGKVGDGGWEVCHDAAVRPSRPCLVYSFGINNDFSFDDAVIDTYGCMVHSFDPSMNQKSYQRNKHNFFHNIGLSSENFVTPQGWEIKRLDKIRQDLGHSKDKISILKMDIELFEWDVLPDILNSGFLEDVDALFVEFHLNLVVPPTESGRQIYTRALKILKGLYDLGFRIFYMHRNPSLMFNTKCTNIERINCHEVNFIKVKKGK